MQDMLEEVNNKCNRIEHKMSRICMTETLSISVKGGNKMNYKIEKKDSFKIVAKTQRFTKIEDVKGII